MKKLQDYLKQNKKEAILAPVFKMLEATFELLVPVIVAGMIDTGVADRNLSGIIRPGILLFFLAAAGLCFSITAQYFSAKAAACTGQRIRDDLFRHIQTFSWQQIDRIGTSTLITRMTSDINTVQNGINMFLRLFLRSPFVVFGAVLMAFVVDAHTALVFAVVVPLLFVAVFSILLITMPLYRKVQMQLDLLMQKARENLQGFRVIRAFNRQQKEKNAFSANAETLAGKQIFAGKISALLNPMSLFLVNGGIIALLWFGGKEINLGALSQGKIVAQINYMTQILTELIKLANLVIMLSRATASWKRISEILSVGTKDMDKEHEAAEKISMQNTHTEKADAEPSCGISVDFQDVTFSYEKGTAPVLQNITFHLSSGSTLGIIGGTGAGKSTILHLLLGFYQPDHGCIKINGRNLADFGPEKLRSMTGDVPQRAVLFQGTLRENMQWGFPDADDKQIWKALCTAQAEEFVREKNNGLDFFIEQEGRNLSGGQKQRLTIARALTRDPALLLLDDSASALDFATDAALRRALASEQKNRTMILISQRVSSVRNADNILVLRDGTAVGFGTHEKLLQTCREYQEICSSQLSEEMMHN